MTDVKYLSNKELVNELYDSNNSPWSEDEHNRRIELKNEILRRLNEIWRK